MLMSTCDGPASPPSGRDETSGSTQLASGLSRIHASAYRVHCRCMRPCERTNVCGRLVTQKKRVTPSFLVRRWRRVQGRSFVKIKDIAPHPADKVDPRWRFFPGKVLEAVTCVSDVPMWGAGADDGVGWPETEAARGALRAGRRKDSTETAPEGGPNPARPPTFSSSSFRCRLWASSLSSSSRVL